MATILEKQQSQQQQQAAGNAVVVTTQAAVTSGLVTPQQAGLVTTQQSPPGANTGENGSSSNVSLTVRLIMQGKVREENRAFTTVEQLLCVVGPQSLYQVEQVPGMSRTGKKHHLVTNFSVSLPPKKQAKASKLKDFAVLERAEGDKVGSSSLAEKSTTFLFS